MLVRAILPALVFLPLTHSAPLEIQSQSPLEPSSGHRINLSYRRPTRYESTVLARRLLALSTTGVISTIFPPNNQSASPASPQPNQLDNYVEEEEEEHDDDDDNDIDDDKVTKLMGFTPPPPSVASLSISLPDYLSDCDQPSRGNPTLLFLDPSTSSRNTHAQHQRNNLSLSLSWWDQYPLLTGHRPWAPADLPRLSLIGHVEEIPLEEARDNGLVNCFLRAHPDARLWLPGDKHAAHPGRWVRMVVEEVYWMGGFGDRHWIGWFDIQEWRNVERKEWEAVRLPGEQS